MGRMRITLTVFSLSLIVLLIASLGWLGQAGPAAGRDQQPHDNAQTSDIKPLCVGIIPEREIFEQRRRYRVLADYLAEALDRPIELVTASSYHGALDDMAAGRTDIAFMGSLVAALTLEQLQAQVLVKPETADGVTTYRGVIFVRADSPIQDLHDLAGRSIGMLRTTTAGHLYPIHTLSELGLLTGPEAVSLRWLGTHDQVAYEVEHGRIDAGAAKNLRIDAYEQAHPLVRFRRLAEGDPVPNNALVVRGDLEPALVARLRDVLLGMDRDEAGRDVLSAFGAARFVPCQPEEYQSVYDMAKTLGPGWGRIGQSDEQSMRDTDGFDGHFIQSEPTAGVLDNKEP